MFKVNLITYKNILIVEILDMPEEYRNINVMGAKTLSTMEGYAIRSILYPQLAKKTLYMRGRLKERDKKIVYFSYSTVEETVKAKAMFEEMIKRLNEERRKNESK